MRERMREWIIPVSHMHLSFIAVHVYLLGELLDDEEEVLDNEMEIISRASANVEAQDLEDEAVRITARAGHYMRSSYTTIDDVPLPFRVPRSTDPSIWSVRVKVGILHYVPADADTRWDSLDKKPMSYSKFAIGVLCLVKSTHQPSCWHSLCPLYRDMCSLRCSTSEKLGMQ